MGFAPRDATGVLSEMACFRQLTSRDESQYFSSMSRRYAELERQSWLMTKAAGRNRFIWRQMLYSLVFWLILMPLLDLLAFITNPLSVQNVVIDLILLPVCLLGGYLEANWRWQDLEKKYPADTLPSGE